MNNQQTQSQKNLQNNTDTAPAFSSGGGASYATSQQAKASPTALALERTSSDLLRRVPPHNVEAEQAVLGGILLRNTVLHSIVDVLTPDDFYLPSHQTLFSAFLELYRTNAPIDLVSVASYLKDQKKLELIGGSVMLAELVQQVISGANAEYYATIIRDKSLQRSLIDTCSDIISDCFDASRPVDSLLDESEQRIFSIAERTSGKTFKSTKLLVDKVFEDLAKRMNNNETVTGVTTGYTRLDHMTAGLQPSDLIILAARPAMGKTAFALNMAMHAAIRDNVPVAIFSLEMSMEQLMMRMLCVEGRVSLSNVRRGFLAAEEWVRLQQAADTLALAPIYIDDSPALSPLELRARTRRLKAEVGVGLVMIDYLQLMRSSRKIDSREQEISEISRSLKGLAKELHIPVVALSQLNRKLEDRADKRPMLSDLRESGAIEQDADVILFIYRDEVYNKAPDNPKIGIAEIIIGKQRNGPIGETFLAYRPEFTRFEDLEPTVKPSEFQ